MKKIVLLLFLYGSIGAMENAFVVSKELAEKHAEQQAAQAGLALGSHINLSFSCSFSNRNVVQAAIAKQNIPEGLSGRDPLMYEYMAKHLQGDIKALQKELETVNKKISNRWPFPMRYEKRQVVTLQHLLSQPAMECLNIIADDSRPIAKAQQALFRLKQIFQAEVAERELNTKHVTVTELQLRSAHDLFIKRVDYNPQLILTAPNSITGQLEVQRFSSQTNSVSVQSNNALVDEEAVSTSAASIVQHCDMVSTPARPVPNISWEVDAAIEAAFKHVKQAEIAYSEIHGKSPDFDEQMKAVGATLDYMKEQGLLNPSKDEFQEAVRHGIAHFLKEFDPSTIVDDPQTFIMNTTRHIAMATFHVMTDGMFLAADRAAALASQVYDLYQLMNTNFSSLTPNERAELIAERIADIIKTIFADLVTRKTLVSAGGGAAGASSVTTTQEVHEVVASDGTSIQVRGDSRDALLKDGAIKTVLNRETVLPKVKTYEQARKKALEIIGEVDVHSGEPHLCRLGTEKGKIVGRRWHNRKVIMRLDYDPVKGPHINITDYRASKGIGGTVVCIPFDGSESTYRVLVKNFNSVESLRQAKIIFESRGNLVDSNLIDSILQKITNK